MQTGFIMTSTGFQSGKPQSACHYRVRAAAAFIAGLVWVASPVATADIHHPRLPGGWHLLRTPNPRGGPDAVSISHTADTARSDLDLAGVMLRCGEKALEFVVVVVTPFSRSARPTVAIATAGKQWSFVASPIAPGAALLLPPEAMSLATGPWQLARELTIKVTWQQQSFGGVISLEGLAVALATLTAECPAG
jgi:hypothetical protein